MYTAISIDVFIAAYAGAMASFQKGRVPSNQSLTSYDRVAKAALAYAESFDTEFAVILPNSLQLEEIESISTEIISYPNNATTALIPASYTGLSQAVIAMMSEADAVVAANVTNPIPFPSPPSGIPVVQLATVVGVANSLKSTVPGTGIVAAVDGYASAGDGGSAGLYYWLPGFVGTANDGTIVRPTGALSGAWFAIYSGAINVLWFGAVGNGVTDDLAAITAALGAVPVTGGALYFPGGANPPFLTINRVYKLSDRINVGNYANLKVYSDGGAVLQVTKNKRAIDFTSCPSLEVSGLHVLGTIQVDGGNPGGGNEGQTGIVISFCDDANIHDNVFENLGGYAVFIGQNNTRVSVHHNFCPETMAGIQTGGENVGNAEYSICDNYLKGFIPTGGAGTLGSDDLIAILGGDKIQVCRNIIDKRGIDAPSRAKVQAQCIDIATVDASITELVCCENICLNSRSDQKAFARAAIQLAIASTGTFKNVIIADNIIKEVNAGIFCRVDGTAVFDKIMLARNQITSVKLPLDGLGNYPPDAISVKNGGGGIIGHVDVLDNQIDTVDGIGIVFDDLTSITVRGNSVDACAGANSIQGTTTVDADLSFNQVTNSVGGGIATSDVHHVRCTNNSVISPGGDGITIGVADDCISMGNTVRSGSVNGMRFNLAGKSTVQGNTVSACAASGFAYGTSYDTLFSGNFSYNNGVDGLTLAGDASSGTFANNRYANNTRLPITDGSTTSVNDFTQEKDWMPESLPTGTVISDWNPETGATVVGGKVSALTDSVSAHNMTDGGVGAAGRPTYTAGGPGGLHYMIFDGVANELGTAFFMTVIAQPYSLFIVWEQFNDAVAGVSDVLYSDGGGTAMQIQPAVPRMSLFGGASFNSLSVPNRDIVGGFGATLIETNGASSHMYNNGSLFATGNPGAGGLDSVNLGAYQQVGVAGNRFMHCGIARAILMNGLLSNQNKANLNAYAKRLYALPNV